MGHEDLERRLRTERGPREAGYQPARLPADLPPHPGRPTPPRLLRWGLLGGAAAAAVLVVAGAGALLSAPGDVGSDRTPSVAPSAGPTASTTPVASGTPVASTAPSAPGQLAACSAADFAVTTDPWGGAAGSRGTNVVLRLVDGGASCTLDGAPAAGIDDATGQDLVRSTPVASTPRVLDPGQMVTVGLSWSNWCQAGPATPLRAWMVLSGSGDEAGADRIPLVASDGGQIPVPPCMGAPGDPASMSVTEFQPYSAPRPQG